MMHKSRHTSVAPLTLCLVLVLGVAFLAPLCHTHDHAGALHDGGGDHVLLQDASAGEMLATAEGCRPHLHVAKGSPGLLRHQHLKNRQQRSVLYAVAAPAVFCRGFVRSQRASTGSAVFRSNALDCRSGLSPPAA